jgi:hypothetical protein
VVKQANQSIDIGTSRSGYAFTFNDQTNITLNTFENEGLPPFFDLYD